MIEILHEHNGFPISSQVANDIMNILLCTDWNIRSGDSSRIVSHNKLFNIKIVLIIIILFNSVCYSLPYPYGYVTRNSKGPTVIDMKSRGIPH